MNKRIKSKSKSKRKLKGGVRIEKVNEILEQKEKCKDKLKKLNEEKQQLIRKQEVA